uniref:Microtubule-associated protein MAP65-1a n=1 Tax=Oryza coarctata TaxID=77588 RepID=C0JAB5_ORYCO|nr:microtubule-associated protein MAP65-1a [Oryza coarctata]
MGVAGHNDPLIGETTCGSLLQQLQLIWDEVSESDEDRDKMLLQLEQECLDVSRRKVDQASSSRARLLQQLANAKSELSRLLCALGELSVCGIPDKTTGTIKEQLAVISPFLEKLCREKDKRVREFADVQLQIQTIRGEIAGSLQVGDHMEKPHVNEDDLSTKKLNEFLSELQALQKEMSNRLHKILDLSKSISDATLSKLSNMVIELKEVKLKRLEKVQALTSQLTDLWNLMHMSVEECQHFHHVTCNMSSTLDEVTVLGALDLDLIEQAELEVVRLDQLKASRMKDIAFKRQTELEDIYVRAHVVIDTSAARDRILTVIDSIIFEPSELLADMENQIFKAKEEALSRKDILEKVYRWMSACEEESWLEDYSQDDNRYSATRGAHLNLKRAEKTRLLVSKIPAIVDTLMAKTRAWEQEHGVPFNYDGVHLLAMVDEYKILRQKKEEEKRGMRDQKKINDQLAAEQEKLFGWKPSPARPRSSRKTPGPWANSGAANDTLNRRLLVHRNSGGRSPVERVLVGYQL